jgi:flagellar secretion chaperone FliS
MTTNQYLINQVETASPQKLVLLLYDGAINFLNRALAIEDLKQDIEQTNYLINKAYAIVSELQKNLDYSVGEIANNLFALYSYMSERLMEANMKKEKEPLLEVHKMLSELQDGWSQIVYKQIDSTADADQVVGNDTLMEEMVYAAGGVDFSG